MKYVITLLLLTTCGCGVNQYVCPTYVRYPEYTIGYDCNGTACDVWFLNDGRRFSNCEGFLDGIK